MRAQLLLGEMGACLFDGTFSFLKGTRPTFFFFSAREFKALNG